ncbi:Transmembrane amino acid transporter protein [Spraguea lophii 42_110]|uniref:Transmembrane amino acid transporter protein n=1 Tax=Spraguea lophii (strain 42_110) TaxID=1358809 RepID=S7WC31_SPRLO|nr:Transmembrane amino acid transporter protein [Spraguea lophii 42_110]
MDEVYISAVNLLKTIIGSGILYFPMLFGIYGPLAATLFTIVSGFFAIISLRLLTHMNRIWGDRKSTLSSMSLKTVPSLRIVIDICVFFKCWNVSSSYLIIAGHLLPKVIYSAFYVNVSSRWLLFLFLLLISPLTFFKKLKHLKYTSFLGVLSIVFVVSVSVAKLILHKEMLYGIKYVKPISKDWLKGLGTFIFACTCQQNIISIHNELNNQSKIKNVIYMSISTGIVLYILFGFCNWILFYNFLFDNVLQNYPDTTLTNIIRILYIIVLGVSYPLQINPCRTHLINCFKLNHSSLTTHILITVGLLSSTFFLAISGVELGEIYAFTGATASTFIALILPSLFYLSQRKIKDPIYTVFSFILLISGILVFSSAILKIIL